MSVFHRRRYVGITGADGYLPEELGKRNSKIKTERRRRNRAARKARQVNRDRA